ncbi:hypothetical protein H6G97_26640 [Nostoc flagelliforme FACHB-838]|uniref:Uncharacterized protein n=1 Tax=Nostoc flagelliforme FACHB-838 TaxID=2692904 RepID=A0ABR8DU89_9NOSO|nr:hypothetical protein [Nostoc flagelliforme]MBD2532959.1 hypothetical protein [Nostoc flagelliforme FACHB-838]
MSNNVKHKSIRRQLKITGVAYLRDDLATSKILPLLPLPPLPPLLASIHPTVLQRQITVYALH